MIVYIHKELEPYSSTGFAFRAYYQDGSSVFMGNETREELVVRVKEHLSHHKNICFKDIASLEIFGQGFETRITSPHMIPLGALVVVNISIEEENDESSVRLAGTCILYVVGHMKDCDGTPLYQISDIPVAAPTSGPFSDEYMLYRTISTLYRIGYDASQLEWVDSKPCAKLYKSVSEYLQV